MTSWDVVYYSMQNIIEKKSLPLSVKGEISIKNELKED
jgi:hypothetical protein